ncbi:MAG: bifunctional DNA-formamidopyrimidine glycosylase/DNA-(apurinic or apyrimidinic site) lyase [Anaerolineaceae bacterium]|nr:bifunctional DNA-formamidopyrimidine glycosylase/DNA-(apurinic or apyrimidinic site) lyase [Anaerolineaceae bacterium]
MPELPEVETVVRGLRAPLIGRRIESVWYEREKVIQMPSAEQFTARIIGQTVQAISRRAKYIICQLDHDILAVHLKMTGRLFVAAPVNQPPEDRWVRLRLGLDNGEELCFSDARRFGRVYLASSVEEITPALGPEPLEDDFTPTILAQQLQGRSKAIKALLLDQSFVAGVGNIYADEALHRAGIHPQRPANSLTKPEIKRLYSTIREVLNKGIEYQGATLNWYRKPDGSRGESQDHFYVYDREGEPCLTCGAPIVKIRVAQRGTHYCPHCQPEK